MQFFLIFILYVYVLQNADMNNKRVEICSVKKIVQINQFTVVQPSPIFSNKL